MKDSSPMCENEEQPSKRIQSLVLYILLRFWQAHQQLPFGLMRTFCRSSGFLRHGDATMYPVRSRECWLEATLLPAARLPHARSIGTRVKGIKVVIVSGSNMTASIIIEKIVSTAYYDETLFPQKFSINLLS